MSDKSPVSALLWAGVASEIVYLSVYTIEDYTTTLKGLIPFVLCFIPYLYLLCIFLRGRYVPDGQTLYWIILFSILFQVTLLPGAPVLDDDIFRYIWDGRVLAEGINPYRYAPADISLKPLRDDLIYPEINYNYIPTIYPPFSQVIFYIAYLVGPNSIILMKSIITLFNILVVWLIVRILEHLGMRKEMVFVYAWNPMMLKEVSNSGHIEPVMMAFVLLSVYLILKKRVLLSGVSLALAILSKVFPLFLLPLFARRIGLKGMVMVVAVGGFFYLPFAISIPDIEGLFTGLLVYSRYWIFNPGPFDLLRIPISWIADDHIMVTRVVTTGIILAVTLYLAIRDDLSERILIRNILVTTGLVILLSPVVDPWYLLWILPFLCLYVHIPWIVFTGLVLLSYLYYLEGRDVVSVRWVEYGLFFLLLLYGNKRLLGLMGLCEPNGRFL